MMSSHTRNGHTPTGAWRQRLGALAATVALGSVPAASLMAGGTAVLALAGPAPVMAQTTGGAVVNGAARIEAFSVKPVARIAPGAELDFTLWGTPGANVSLQVAGAQRTLPMVETRPGIYEGTYTVSLADRIDTGAAVDANLRVYNRVVTARLDTPLVQGWQPTAANGNPAISRLDVRTGPRPRVGDTVHLSLSGTPGGRASVTLPSPNNRTLLLTETRPGTYEADYVLLPGDPQMVEGDLKAYLYHGRQVASTQMAWPANVRELRRTVAAPCYDCGSIVAVNRVEVAGNGSLIGTALGGVIGGALGNQVGKGDGRTAATVAGVIGGAILGKEIEARQGQQVKYEVVVQMEQGAQRTVLLDNPGAWRVGEPVRVVDNQLVPA